MCGIALQFAPGRKATALSLERLRHRGPDGRGEWSSPDGACWMGHTRLAILDLTENGAQPMTEAAGRYVLVFNGEIYNHRELRGALSERAIAWRGESDTETLLEGYRAWGANVVSRLKGMFAFAVYDRESNALFVARDRFGMKPLYYTWREGVLTLASEVRVLLAEMEPKISRAGVSAYLTQGSCPESSLLWPSVQLLPAAHCLTLSADGRLETKSYWVPSPRKSVSRIPTTERVRELIEYSVEDHLQSDVPVGVFLSGGVDSSILTALAAQKLSRPLLTFSVGFAQKDFDETSVAAEVARRYRTDHHRIELDERKTAELVCEAVQRMDIPSVDAINTYIVADAVAKQGVKVAITGLGGDELFGGYPIFNEMRRLKWLASVPRSIRRLLGMAGSMGRRLAELPSLDVRSIVEWRRRFMTQQESALAGLPALGYPAHAGWPSLCDEFAEISWSEISGYMRGMLLRDSDQMSMACSLELRVPFLDHELVEYVLQLPASEKRRYPGTKGLLVAACKDLLPESVYRRPKLGFGLPMQQWMCGPLSAFVQSGIEHLRARDLVKAPFLDQCVQDFASGAAHWTRLWSVVVLGHYLNTIKTAAQAESFGTQARTLHVAHIG